MPTDVAFPSGFCFRAASQSSPTEGLTNDDSWQSPAFLSYDPEEPPTKIVEQQNAAFAEWRSNRNLKPAAATTPRQFTEVVYLDGTASNDNGEVNQESPSSGLRERAQRRLYGATHRNKPLSDGITKDDAADALAFACEEPQQVSQLLQAGQDYTRAESVGNGGIWESLDSREGAIDIVRHVKSRKRRRNKKCDG